jgi:hypothetical protein
MLAVRRSSRITAVLGMSARQAPERSRVNASILEARARDVALFAGHRADEPQRDVGAVWIAGAYKELGQKGRFTLDAAMRNG